MIARRHIVLALVSIMASMGASYRTQNFVVHAPNDQIAQQVGQLAEHYRREKAVEWLGREMPPWPQPCPLYVRVTMNGPSGATSFNFGRDQQGRGMVMGQRMEISGPLDRLLASVLPHEITHTIFAHHYKQPVPRWADEGGSVLSEDDIERVRHDKLTRQILNGNQQIPFRTLLRLTEYPQGKVMQLYAQGYSLTEYLVHFRGDRALFLKFVGIGMQNGNNNWDQAAWVCYQHRNVDELEQAWLKHLRESKGQDHIQLAQNRSAQPKGQTSGTMVRLTVPTDESFQPTPTYRGQGPDEDERPRYGSPPAFLPTAAQQDRPGYLPEPRPTAPNWQAPQSGPPQVGAMQPQMQMQMQPQMQQQFHQPQMQPEMQPQMQQPYQPVPVRLGPPQFGNQPVGPVPAPQGVSPVGFPQ